MEKKIEEPKDLGIKMGTPEEAFWTGIKDKTIGLIDQCKHEIIIQEEILKLAEKNIAKEKK